MSTQPLDELYFVWLYRQVADPDAKNPALSFSALLKQLFQKEFVWIVPNDDNRAEDGKELRLEFIRDQKLGKIDRMWSELGCSFLELMLGLSRRLSFEAGGEPHYWFWKLMGNLGLDGYSDNRRLPQKKIEDTLNRVIYRSYKRNGLGGFFPLKQTPHDQRKVELWYQLSEYVAEQSE